ncbi:hypothetical protein MHU86_24436 [Fragilaria crotonensis]|nr:hypothetical protein MHU86_24436 [Fragilaria crotonensis]
MVPIWLPCYLFGIRHPWSTILAWVANNLHQVVLRHPTLAFAPTVWVILLFLSVFPSTLLKQPPVASTAPSSPPLTRLQRRRFSRLLKKSFAPPRFNSGIRLNKLHRSYPLRLRQQGYVASRPPTVAERDDFRHFATLKERALRLQRRADSLRNSRRPAPLPPTTGQKGEGYTKTKRSCPSWCSKRPRSSPRTAKYCPVAPANSPDPFAIAPLTFHQRAAANKILSRSSGVPFYAASHGSSGSARMREALGPKQTRAPSFGTRAQAFRSRPTSPISKAPSRPTPLDVQSPPDLPDETITIEPNRLTLSGVPNDANRGPVTANVNPQNNLPTSEAYNATDPFKAADALVSIVNTVHERNLNLNEAEKELLRWHYRLGHVGFKKVQFILRSGVVSKTEESRRLQTAACRLTSFPKCAACQYGKQHRRPIPGTTPSSIVKDRAHALKTDNLLPGQRISVDHFICSTRGRLLTSAGKTKLDDMYTGGCIFVDHASGLFCGASIPTSHPVRWRRRSPSQRDRRTQHPNHHGDCTNHDAAFGDPLAGRRRPTLWPLAVKHAVFLVNHMPDPRTGLSPHDVFTKTRWEQKKLMDVHVWGCPVYVLDKMISDGKKLPRWTPRSTRTVNLGFSDKHASSVPLVLNPQTGYITRSFTSSSTIGSQLFPLPPTTFRTSTTTAGNECSGLYSLRLRCQLRCRLQGANRDATTSRCASSPATPLLTPRRRLRNRLRRCAATPDSNSSQTLPIVADSNSSCKRKRQESERATSRSKGNKAKSTPVKHEPRRSTRNRSAPVRLGYDGQQGHGYMAEFDGTSSNGYNKVAECLSPLSSYKASVSDPDTLSFAEAMADRDNIEKGCKRRNSKFAEKRYMDRSADHGSQDSNFARYLGVSSQTYSMVLSPAFGSSLDPFATWIPLSERPRHVPATPEKLYGLSVAPRLWYQHLSEALREEGFKACANDPCLLYKDTIMVVLYVDDLGIAYRDQTTLTSSSPTWKRKLKFYSRGHVHRLPRHQFHSRRNEWDPDPHSEGSHSKIKEATGMSDSNYNWTPAAQAALESTPMDLP